MKSSFSGQTVVVTGASDGIGRELALQLASSGAHVVAAARSKEKLDQVVDACRARGARAIGVETDVADEAACQRLMQAAVIEFGGINVLINNAGLSMRARFDEITNLQIFERLMRVNYLGAVYCTRYALPELLKSKGLVAAISSLQGKTGFPGSTGYAASKYALQGFFDSLRIELMGSGVSVSIICPGPVATAIHARPPDIVEGVPTTLNDADRSQQMPVQECVAQIMRALSRRDRELLMTPLGKLLPWLRLAAPRFVDRRTAELVRQFYSAPGG